MTRLLAPASTLVAALLPVLAGCTLNPTCTESSCDHGKVCDLDLGICVDAVATSGTGGSSGSNSGSSSSSGSTGAACGDTSSDPANCGTCGNACAATEVCEASACVDPNWAQWPMPNTDDAGLPNAARYDLSVPEIVADQITGLSWQEPAAPQPLTWADAQSYCAALSLGGPGRWRLPTEIELYSLLDLREAAVAIDPAAFGSTPASVFWSTTPSAGSTSSAWGVNFKAGDTGTFSFGNTFNVRCTRMGQTSAGMLQGAGAPPARYQASTSGASMEDLKTGLHWELTLASGVPWSAAATHCAALSADGAGWRLPTVKELMTLIDFGAAAGAIGIDTTAFPATPTDAFWSSTPVAAFPTQAWAVSFGSRTASPSGVSMSAEVRCVR